MADIKLRLTRAGRGASGWELDLEKPLQTLIEQNMDEMFGVRFVKSEHKTGPKHNGRIDYWSGRKQHTGHLRVQARPRLDTHQPGSLLP